MEGKIEDVSDVVMETRLDVSENRADLSGASPDPANSRSISATANCCQISTEVSVSVGQCV